MDERSLDAIALLDAINKSENRLNQFALEMNKKYGSELRYSRPQNSFSIDVCRSSVEHPSIRYNRMMLTVATTLSLNMVVEWDVTLLWNKEHWLIEADVYIDDDETRSMICVKSYEPRIAVTLDECIHYLEAATDFIVASGDAFAIRELAANKKL